MARRSIDWNDSLAKELQDKTFAREFILSAIEEGIPLQVVLRKVVRAYGVKEFATKAKMAGPNLLRAVNPKHNPTLATVNKLLRPFGLKLSVSIIPDKKRLVA